MLLEIHNSVTNKWVIKHIQDLVECYKYQGNYKYVFIQYIYIYIYAECKSSNFIILYINNITYTKKIIKKITMHHLPILLLY